MEKSFSNGNQSCDSSVQQTFVAESNAAFQCSYMVQITDLTQQLCPLISQLSLAKQYS
jgi:hypothetical protein